MPRICLCMIVKDEAHIIEQSLGKLAPLIDYWIICDTGSSDGTQTLIRDFFKAKKIPGRLFEDPWRDDFAYSRSVAIRAIPKSCTFFFMFDADDTITGELVFPKDMDADMYTVNIGENTDVQQRPAIFRTSLKWKYRAVRHEFPVSKITHRSAHLSGNYLILSRRLGARSRDPKRYLNDALAMIRAIPREPDLTRRYTYYVAQSFKDYGDVNRALQWYKKRIILGGKHDEVYLSYFEIACILRDNDAPEEEVIKWFKATWERFPYRAEPFFYLAEYLEKKGKLEEAYKLSKLSTRFNCPTGFLVKKKVYDYNRWLRYGLLAYYTDRFEEALRAFEEASVGAVTDSEHDLVETNIGFTLQKLNKHRRTLAFYIGYADFEDQLTGSERALIELTSRLVSSFYIVIIGLDMPPQLADYRFISISKINTVPITIDILVILNYINYFLYCSKLAGRTYLWLHANQLLADYQGQILPDEGRVLLKNNEYQIDKIVTSDALEEDEYKDAYVIGGDCRFTLAPQSTGILDDIVRSLSDLRLEFPNARLQIPEILKTTRTIENQNWIELYRDDEVLEIMKSTEYWISCDGEYDMEARTAGCQCITHPDDVVDKLRNQQVRKWTTLFAEVAEDDGEWIKIGGYDSVGADMCCIGRQDVSTMKEMARWMPDCVAFNDWGYFKNEVSGVGGWKKMDITLYIRRGHYPRSIPLELSETYGRINKFVINLAHRTDRREHIVGQFPDAQIVEAADKNSDLVKAYTKNCDDYNRYEGENMYDRMAEFACLASHLKVLKCVAESGEYGLVLEDDVIRRDFNVDQVCDGVVDWMKNKSVNLVMLCCASIEMYSHMEQCVDKSKINLCPIVKRICWGTQAYIISPEYARHAYKCYHKTFEQVSSDLLIWDKRITAEVITRNSKGYFTYPPIIIEDYKLQSSIRPENREYHEYVFKRWM